MASSNPFARLPHYTLSGPQHVASSLTGAAARAAQPGQTQAHVYSGVHAASGIKHRPAEQRVLCFRKVETHPCASNILAIDHPTAGAFLARCPGGAAGRQIPDGYTLSAKSSARNAPFPGRRKPPSSLRSTHEFWGSSFSVAGFTNKEPRRFLSIFPSQRASLAVTTAAGNCAHQAPEFFFAGWPPYISG